MKRHSRLRSLLLRFALLTPAVLLFAACTQVADFFDFRPPADVTGAEGVGLDGAVQVTWVDPTDEDLSLIRLSWEGGSVNVARGEEQYTVEGLANETVHTVTVAAVDRAGNAAPGVVLEATPVPPISYQITASWDSLLASGTLSFETESDGMSVRTAGGGTDTNVSAESVAASPGGPGDGSVLSFAPPPRKDPPNRILVKYRTANATESGTAGVTGTRGRPGEDSAGSPSSVRKRIQTVGVERVLATRNAARISAVTPRNGVGKSVGEIIDYYRSLPDVEYAERDQWVYALGTPDDPHYNRQWNFEQLRMPEVWDVQTGRSEVVVAVIDTGIFRGTGMDDLATTSFVPGYNAIADNDDTSDDNSHGTHVAGTVAQSTNDAKGVAGMAYGVSLMPVKVLGQDGLGLLGDIIDGIHWAVDNGADVINLSLGRPPSEGSDPFEVDAVRYAHENGVVVVAATGNTGSNQVGYPAAYDDYVIAVGATRYDKMRTDYSNYGSSLDLVAPGGDTSEDQDSDGHVDGIWQQTIHGYNDQTGETSYDVGLYGYQGTSMAAPHVSALAALLVSRNPELTPSQVQTMMQDTAEDLGSSGLDDEYGYGLIDPLAAMALSVFPTSDSQDGGLHVVENVTDRWKISAGGNSIDIGISFRHADGDLELVLLGPEGDVIATSQTASDGESIIHDAGSNPGTYTIIVRLAN